jgi:hypothetical protein
LLQSYPNHTRPASFPYQPRSDNKCQSKWIILHAIPRLVTVNLLPHGYLLKAFRLGQTSTAARSLSDFRRCKRLNSSNYLAGQQPDRHDPTVYPTTCQTTEIWPLWKGTPRLPLAVMTTFTRQTDRPRSGVHQVMARHSDEERIALLLEGQLDGSARKGMIRDAAQQDGLQQTLANAAMILREAAASPADSADPAPTPDPFASHSNRDAHAARADGPPVGGASRPQSRHRTEKPWKGSAFSRSWQTRSSVTYSGFPCATSPCGRQQRRTRAQRCSRGEPPAHGLP